MSVRISVGGEDFDELRSKGCYYVDKTALLYDLVQNNANKVTLFTRPRRFGKTLTMRMIESFFDIRRDSKDVFDGLAIMKHEAFCAEWMNKHPVLFISFKDAEALRYDTAYAKLKTIISDVCKKHAYLCDSHAVNPYDKYIFRKLSGQAAEDTDIHNSLLTLLRMMHAHFGKKVILLIDEYDVPLTKASEEKEGGERYYGQMLDVVRGIMSTALKTNDYLEFGVVTGCLRIAKESIFTGVNNFTSYSVLDDRYSRYFGFTQYEVDELLQIEALEDKKDIFKEWYDGYVIGSEAVYCPWDVMNYTADLLYRRNAKPKNYWKNTSGNGIVKEFVGRTDFDVTDKFERLMNGGTIVQAVSDELSYDILYDSEDNLWSVLLMTGYLTKAEKDENNETVALRIPNREIAGIFQEAVMRHFNDSIDTSLQKNMMAALWSGDETAAAKAISDLLWQTISYMDYHEDYYHAFLAGIFVGMGYGIESNKERGLGRPDIKLTDKQNRRILLIEAKKSLSESRMAVDCETALRQIVEHEYAKGLDEYEVICYGVAFFRKKALVKKLA